MNDAIFTETIVFKTTSEQADWITGEILKLEEQFGEGFSFSASDVIRRAIFKEMRKKEEK